MDAIPTLFLKLVGNVYVEYKGIARTQSPTNKNCAPESPTFGVIAAVSPTEVQWKGLTLGEPPQGSRYPLCQVSMLEHGGPAGFHPGPWTSRKNGSPC